MPPETQFLHTYSYDTLDQHKIMNFDPKNPYRSQTENFEKCTQGPNFQHTFSYDILDPLGNIILTQEVI